MKKMLLLLLTLIVMPAWAGEAPPVQPSSVQVTQVAPQTAEKSVLESALGAVVKDAHAATCPVACRSMNCPPPNGPTMQCCPRVPYNQTCP